MRAKRRAANSIATEGKKQETKTSQKTENKMREKLHLFSVLSFFFFFFFLFWVQSSVTVYSGSQERGGEVLLLNSLFSTYRDNGRHSTQLMTLRLDTEAGKHRAGD